MTEESGSGYREWTIIQCSHRRPAKTTKVNSVITSVNPDHAKACRDRAESQQNSLHGFSTKVAIKKKELLTKSTMEVRLRQRFTNLTAI